MQPIVWVNANLMNAQKRSCHARRAFSLIDVLVSLAIISVLIGLMLPALSSIRETSRKVVCSSNIRQLGLSMAMYADDYKGRLPYSAYYSKSLSTSSEQFEGPEKLMLARIGGNMNKWDGLGLLFGRQYCSAAQVYYCPSHKSIHRYDAYSDGWNGAPIDVLTNFQYRGGSANNVTNLNQMPDRISLITDGLAMQTDFNHAVGGNVVASDLSIGWFDKTAQTLDLPSSYADTSAKEKLQTAWSIIDFSIFK